MESSLSLQAQLKEKGTHKVVPGNNTSRLTTSVVWEDIKMGRAAEPHQMEEFSWCLQAQLKVEGTGKVILGNNASKLTTSVVWEDM